MHFYNRNICILFTKYIQSFFLKGVFIKGMDRKNRKTYTPLEDLCFFDFPFGEKVKLLRFSFNTHAKNPDGSLYSIQLMVNLRFNTLDKLDKEALSTKVKKIFYMKVLVLNLSNPKFNEYIMTKEDKTALDTLLTTQSLAFGSLQGKRISLPCIPKGKRISLPCIHNG